jgi:hypothetical protein
MGTHGQSFVFQGRQNYNKKWQKRVKTLRVVTKQRGVDGKDKEQFNFALNYITTMESSQ